MRKHLISVVRLSRVQFILGLIFIMAFPGFAADKLSNVDQLISLGDLNHDGNAELAGIRNEGASQSELIVFDLRPDGQMNEVWSFPLPENVVGEWVDMAVADLNLNGRPELVAIMRTISAGSGNTAPWLYGFEWTGEAFDYLPTFVWNWAPDNGLYARPSQIGAADLDGDGLTELMISLSAPQNNLLILEPQGELNAANLNIEYAGLPPAMLKNPSSILAEILPAGSTKQPAIVLIQKRGSQLDLTMIKGSGEDRYTSKALQSLNLAGGPTELIRPKAVASTNLDGGNDFTLYMGSSKGNIYQVNSRGTANRWHQGDTPFRLLMFSDVDQDGLQEMLVQENSRIHWLEQEAPSGDHADFKDILDTPRRAEDAFPSGAGLLLKNYNQWKYLAVEMPEPEEPEAIAETMEATPEPPTEGKEEITSPPLMKKLAMASESVETPKPIKRKPKAPNVILHVGESFAHNIPRQEEMDPGQAYVKFKTYPEGMRLGKDFVLRWNPNKDQLGYHDISYSFAQEIDTTFSLYVNAVPEILSNPPVQAQSGHQYLYQVQLEDLNQEQYFEFELLSSPAGMQVDEEGLIRWIPSDTQLDSQYVTLSVSDGFERTLQKFTLYVNIPPVILEKPGPVAFINEPYVGQIEFQDQNTPNTARVIPVRAPANLIMESSGRITWTPEAKQTGFHDILFELTDDMTTSLDSITLFVNTSPKITSRYNEHVPVGKPWNYNVEVNDPNTNQDISFLVSESSIPSLTISRRGRITWTPTEADLGRQTFTVSVSDGLRDDLQKVIVYVNSAPVLGEIQDTLATVARPYSTTINVQDLNKEQKLNFALLAAPKGMTISPAGQIDWTPTKAQKGWNEVFVKVSDSYSSDTYKFAVYANAPPVIVSKADTMAIATEEYVYELKALDLNTDQTLVFKVHDAPEGVTLTDGDIIRWTPSIDQINAATFKVSVTDGFITNVQKVSLFVNARPEVTSTPSAVVLTDRQYRYQLSSRDLNEDAIAYSKVVLPSGAEMDEAAGLITWTPDASNEGSNTFIIELTDARGSSSFHEFEVNVFQDPKTPIRQMGAFLITLAGIGAMFIMKFLY